MKYSDTYQRESAARDYIAVAAYWLFSTICLAGGLMWLALAYVWQWQFLLAFVITFASYAVNARSMFIDNLAKAISTWHRES